MQMKTTMRCGYAPLRMANINIATAPNAGEDAEMRTPHRCVWLHRSGKEFDPPTQEPHAWTSVVCPTETKTSVDAGVQTRMSGAGEIGTIESQNWPRRPSAGGRFNPPRYVTVMDSYSVIKRRRH